jgi:hypothetical protein
MTDNRCLTATEIIEMIKAKEKPNKHLETCQDCLKEWNYWQDILYVGSGIEMPKINHLVDKVAEQTENKDLIFNRNAELFHDSYLIERPLGRRTGYVPSRYLSFRSGDLRINLRLAPDIGERMSVVVGIDPVIPGALEIDDRDHKTLIHFDDSGIASATVVKNSKPVDYAILLDSGEIIKLSIPKLNEND